VTAGTEGTAAGQAPDPLAKLRAATGQAAHAELEPAVRALQRRAAPGLAADQGPVPRAGWTGTLGPVIMDVREQSQPAPEAPEFPATSNADGTAAPGRAAQLTYAELFSGPDKGLTDDQRWYLVAIAANAAQPRPGVLTLEEEGQLRAEMDRLREMLGWAGGALNAIARGDSHPRDIAAAQLEALEQLLRRRK